MAFKKPVVNKIKVDFTTLSIYLRSGIKFGKSTLFRDVVIEKYGDPEYGLLVPVGAEDGTKLLDNLNKLPDRMTSWKDMKELKTWLIKEKGKEHNIKLVAFDVVDELIPIAEEEIIRQSNIENPKKQVKTINSACGGYGEGKKAVVKLLKDYFTELMDNGIGVWCIGHTKLKSIKEKSALDDGYQALSSVLSSDYEAIFSGIFDCVLTGYIDKGLESETVTVGGNSKEIKHATSCERRLYFRNTEFIEAGCRFSGSEALPEYLVFDKQNMAKDFIETLENGMKASITVKDGKSTPVKESKPKKVEEPVEVKEEVVEDEVVEEVPVDEVEESPFYEDEDELIEDEDDDVVDLEANKELMTEIKSLFAKATKEQKVEIKEILAKNGDSGLNVKAKTKTLKMVLALLQ